MRSWEFEFTEIAKRQLAFWNKNDASVLLKIDNLLFSIKSNPRAGIGKPERLRYAKIETWSRRIDKKNRIQYQIVENRIIIISLIGHYED